MGRGRPRKHAAAAMEGLCNAMRVHGDGDGGGGGGGGGGVGVGALNIPEAPVYYPTLEQFADPLAFIESIRAEAERYGICRIVPPAEVWRPPFARDQNSFSFPTKVQAIHQLQQRPASCDTDTFNLEYSRFLLLQQQQQQQQHHHHQQKRPTTLKPRPVVFQSQEVDLCALFHAVKRHGGFQRVVEKRKWGDVIRMLDPDSMSSNAYYNSVLKQLYEKHLYQFELHQAANGLGKRGRRGSGTSVSVSASAGKRRRKCDGEDEEEDESEGTADQICQQCRSGLHEELMLLCDRCNKGWHIYCLSPPLKSIPCGNWYCLDCLNSEKDSFGFVPGQHYSLHAFRRYADRFKRRWFGSVKVSHSDIERKFWQIVEGSAGEVEVLYGSDLDTSIYGSGFPRHGDEVPASADPKLWKEYALSPWNLNNFPKLDRSMLRLVHENIAGVMVPWLYIGMLFSSFCWHFEDHCFYSVNYMHWGEPKCWYSVPGNAANAFEQVMRNVFPDLFEAQPDLLFQLVTMLSPTILKENKVPVYTTLQEPGNFVITFPKSFHGGFNCGLNCAEAVNFAPADWLPHGGFAVELYRLYHKSAVLSHDELCCVVAKSGAPKEAWPFLKKELQKIVNNERTFREKLWRKGFVKMNRMDSKYHSGFGGPGEDPECVICRYYLHLSAIVCGCRPGASVCLRHADRLCECIPDQKFLLYRYTIAELEDLLHADEENYNEQNVVKRDCRVRSRRVSAVKTLFPHRKDLQRKWPDVSIKDLADQWLANTHRILQEPISQNAITSVLNEADQFLWAGHEMDSVRLMVDALIKAQEWSQNLNDCLLNIQEWMKEKSNNSLKVSLKWAKDLVVVDPVPCIDDGFAKLKGMVEDGSILEEKIIASLSRTVPIKIVDLEDLQLQVIESPFEMDAAKDLKTLCDSVKECLKHIEKFLEGGTCHQNNLDDLYNLKNEAMKIPVELPQIYLLEKLIQQVEDWQTRANNILKTSIKIEELNNMLDDAKIFNVYIPEQQLLSRYKSSAQDWIERFNNIRKDVSKQTDFSKSVDDLKCLLIDGRALKIKLEDVDAAEFELGKALWREKAYKSLVGRAQLRIFEELITEIPRLHIENEAITIEVLHTVEASHRWEEMASNILNSRCSIKDFEDVIRKADYIKATLPSLCNVIDAFSNAQNWLEKAKPFLEHCLLDNVSRSPCLQVGELKVILDDAKLLKVSLKEPDILRSVLGTVEDWCSEAFMLLASINILLQRESEWNKAYANDGERNNFIMEVEDSISQLKLAIEKGISLGFELSEIRRLRGVMSALQWNLKALSFTSMSPSLEDVQSLIDDCKDLSISEGECRVLQSSLYRSKKWLRKALKVFPTSSLNQKCSYEELNELFLESQGLKISFPMKVKQIESAMYKHMSLHNQVSTICERMCCGFTFSELLKQKELGELLMTDPILERLSLKISEIQNWISECKDVFDGLSSSSSQLEDVLIQVKSSLDKGIQKLQFSRVTRNPEHCCMCEGKEGHHLENLVLCTLCKDRFHSSCFGIIQGDSCENKHLICRFCLAVRHGSLSEGDTVAGRKCRPNIGALIGLVKEAEELPLWTKEVELVQSIVKCAREWESYIQVIVNGFLQLQDKVTVDDEERLINALKAAEIVQLVGQESDRLSRVLCINSWRRKAKEILEGFPKPTLKYIQRVLKEGVALEITCNDKYFQEIRRIENVASQWAVHARKVVDDDGALELDGVFKLISNGERLPVDFSKELEDLKVRSVLYCICRKPYNKQRAMIACDRCSEWYHFDCISLPEPVSDDVDCESLPQTENAADTEFICPACCPLEMEETCIVNTKVKENDSELLSDGVTPPYEFLRGKRRSKVTGKARDSLQRRLKGGFDPDRENNSSIYREQTNAEHSVGTETELTASGRPCRRTAGQHSRFESFILLTHTR